jgi:hypothetical protein
VLERLQRQSVPVILLEIEGGFRESFPLVMAYIDQRYHVAGTHVFDRRFGVALYVRRDATPTGTWQPLGWPCYGAGSVIS